MKLFLSGFTQVFLVVINTYFISKGFIWGVVICSFGISYFWSHNVKKVAFGKEKERIIYATGAMAGGLCGYYLGRLFAH